MKTLRFFILFSLFFILFALGYAKDYLSVLLNTFLKLIHQLEASLPAMAMLGSIIYLTKWAVTFTFIILYSTLGIAIVHLFLKNRNYTKLMMLSYVGLTAGAALIQLAGTALFNYEAGYLLAHRITNFIQTPLPVFIFILGSYVQRQIKK